MQITVDPLYEDSQIVVHRELIVINKYYFPLATSKTILFKDIQYILMQSSEGVTHRWGVCPKYLNNWFPLDSNRKKKTRFIEFVLTGKKTRPSITPDYPEKVFQLIWQIRTKEGRQFGIQALHKQQATQESLRNNEDNKVELK